MGDTLATVGEKSKLKDDYGTDKTVAMTTGKDKKASEGQTLDDAVDWLFSNLDDERKRNPKLDGLARNMVQKIDDFQSEFKDEKIKRQAIRQLLAGDRRGCRRLPSRDDTDICTRWRMLICAIDEDAGEGGKVADLVCGAIMETWPMLALVCLHCRKERAALLGNQCTAGDGHVLKRCETALLSAAKTGNHTIVATIVGGILQARRAANAPEAETADGADDALRLPKTEEALSKLLTEFDASDASDDAKTALSYATEQSHTPLETLNAILPAIKLGQVTPEAVLFESQLAGGHDVVVKTYLDKGLRLGGKLADYILTALTSFEAAMAAEEGAAMDGGAARANANSQKRKPTRSSNRASVCHRKIAVSLAKLVNAGTAISARIATKIIKNGLDDVWGAMPSDTSKDIIKDTRLHIAVQHQQLKFVLRFVDNDDPALERELPESNLGAHIPLWFNNHIVQNNGPVHIAQAHPRLDDKSLELRRKIRDAIVPRMIYTLNTDQLVSLLGESGGEHFLAFFFSLCFGHHLPWQPV